MLKWNTDCGWFEYSPSFCPVTASSITKSLGSHPWELSATQIPKNESKPLTENSLQTFLYALPQYLGSIVGQ